MLPPLPPQVGGRAAPGQAARAGHAHQGHGHPIGRSVAQRQSTAFDRKSMHRLRYHQLRLDKGTADRPSLRALRTAAQTVTRNEMQRRTTWAFAFIADPCRDGDLRGQGPRHAAVGIHVGDVRPGPPGGRQRLQARRQPRAAQEAPAVHAEDSVEARTVAVQLIPAGAQRRIDAPANPAGGFRRAPSAEGDRECDHR
jgi:hypothetical protein